MGMESHLLEQVFVKQEAAFNDTAYTTFAAGDAILHRALTLEGRHNRVPSPEKRGTPDRTASLPRRFSAAWNLSAASWQPSGTLGTASDLSDLLEALVGSKVAAGSGAGVTTTVAASPAPTATGFTVASATGLAVGDVIVVTMPLGHREATRIKTINTAALTVDALSVAPASGAAVVAGVTYKLTTALPPSLAIGKFYTQNNYQEAVSGALVESGEFTFEGEAEALVALSGPAARYRRTGFSKPGSQTLAGEPLTCMLGNFYVGATAFPVTRARLSVANNFGLKTGEIGQEYATAAFRSAHRDVRLEVAFYLDQDEVIDLAETPTTTVGRLVVGNVNGKMLGFLAPKVEFEIATPPAGDTGPVIVTASSVCYAVDGNDQVFLFEA